MKKRKHYEIILFKNVQILLLKRLISLQQEMHFYLKTCALLTITHTDMQMPFALYQECLFNCGGLQTKYHARCFSNADFKPQQTTQSKGYTISGVLSVRISRKQMFNQTRESYVFVSGKSQRDEQFPTPGSSVCMSESNLQYRSRTADVC